MTLGNNFLDWYAARLSIAVYDTNQEWKGKKMAVQVKGLADTVRQAKQAIAKASDVAVRVNDSANQLVSTMAAVEAMTSELDRANADLQGALGTITNGGPPLDDGESSVHGTLNLDQAASVVANANAKPVA